MKSLILLLALGVLSVSCANLPKKQEDVLAAQSSTSVARGGWGSASEFFSGPAAIFFAPVLAVGLIMVLWVAAYNTLRSSPPKLGFGGGAQGGSGWSTGGWAPVPSSGWPAPVEQNGGWAAPAGSESGYAEAAAGSENQAQAATVASAVEQTVAATGQRSLNDLTHRVLESIERGEAAQY